MGVGAFSVRPYSLRWRGASLVVLAIAFALRLNVFGPEELGFDGFVSVGLALEDWPTFVSFQVQEPHPPLYYLALRVWMLLAGPTFAAARWPSVASGLLSIALCARIARSLGTPATGALAAFLLALTPGHIYASAIARDFAPGLALSLLAVSVFPVGARRGRLSGRSLVVLALATAAATATWYFHVAVVVVQAALLPFSGASRHHVSLALGGGLLATTPWLAISMPHLVPQLFRQTNRFTGQAVQPVAFSDFALWFSQASTGSWPGWSWEVSAGLVVAVTIASWLVLATRRQGISVVLAAGGTCLGLLVAYAAVTRWSGPALAERYLLLVIPFLWLGPLVAVAHLSVPAQVLGSVGLCLLAVPMLASYRNLASIEPFPYTQLPIFAFLRQHVGPEDVVVFVDISWRGLYGLAGPPAPAKTVHYVGTHYFPDQLEGGLALLRPSLQRARQVWLVNNLPGDPTRIAAEVTVVERLLQVLPLRGRFLVEEDPEMVSHYGPTAGTLALLRFGPGPVASFRSGLDVVFGDAFRLVEAAGAAEAWPGETLAIALSWEARATRPIDYSVFVHVRDADGRTVAQGDSWPRFGARPTSMWQEGERLSDPHIIPLPADLPPGTYRVVVGLSDGKGRLPVDSGGNEVLVGEIRLER